MRKSGENQRNTDTSVTTSPGESALNAGTAFRTLPSMLLEPHMPLLTYPMVVAWLGQCNQTQGENFFFLLSDHAQMTSFAIVVSSHTFPD